MRLAPLIFTGLASTVIMHAQGTVSLRNVSYPYTRLEVGNTVEVTITGAAPFGTVTVVENGGSPFEFGSTNGFGDWSTTGVETAGYVGSYNQRWYVNGVEMTPNNPDATYLPFAPRLPSFNVYTNFVGSNCAAQSTVSAGCGASNNARHWIWTPVMYRSTSSLPASNVSGAVSPWNSIQSKLSFSTDPYEDVLISDGSAGGANGVTSVYGQDCNTGCYNNMQLCNGQSTNQCFNAAAMYYATVVLDPSVISTAASFNGTTFAAFGQMTLTHELGHALRLADIAPVDGKCSEVQSIMYGSGSMLWNCGVRNPNSSCDASSINTVYPSAAYYCIAPYCQVPGQSCS